jgi:hypothetical protein
VWVVQNSEFCHDRKTRGRRSQGDEYVSLSDHRRFIDLELWWYGRIDGVSVAIPVFSMVSDGPGLPMPGTRPS